MENPSKLVNYLNSNPIYNAIVGAIFIGAGLMLDNTDREQIIHSVVHEIVQQGIAACVLPDVAKP